MTLKLIKLRFLITISEMFQRGRKGKRAGTGFKVLIGFLLVYVVVIFFSLFFFMFTSMAGPFVELGLPWFYFSLAALITFMLCFVGSVFATQTQLFEAKDNELLLSMPISPGAILGSRIAFLLLLNYIFAAFVMIPASVAWFINMPVTAPMVIILVISTLLLPLLVMTFSCIFGWLIALISSRMRKKNVVTLILSLAFFAAYFIVMSNYTRLVEVLIREGAAIADAVRRVLFPIYHFGVAIAEESILSFIFFALCAILPFVAVYYVLKASFVKIATSNRGAARVKYVEKRVKAKSAAAALLKNEITHFVSNAMYILNAAIGSIFMLILGVLMVVNRNVILNFMAAFGELDLPIAPLIAALLCACACMNFISAPSISLEGKNIWILQSLPVKSSTILTAKAMSHFVVAEATVVVAGVLCAVAVAESVLDVLLIILMPSVFSLFMGYLGVFMNLKFPKLDFISEIHAVKQSLSTIVTMFGGMAVAALFILLYVFVFRKLAGIEIYMLACGALLLLVTFAITRYFKNKGGKIFESLSA